MAAIIDIQTGSRISRTSAEPVPSGRQVAAGRVPANLRVIQGGQSAEAIHMRRVYFFRRCFVAAVAVLLVTVGVFAVRALSAGTISESGASIEGGSTYVVQSGDTLWGVAQSVAPDRDPRGVIDLISEANRGDGANFDVNLPLQPGQELVIPEIG